MCESRARRGERERLGLRSARNGERAAAPRGAVVNCASVGGAAALTLGARVRVADRDVARFAEVAQACLGAHRRRSRRFQRFR